jgi:hypothetical protein
MSAHDFGGSHLVSGICLFDLAATFSCKLLCLGQQITIKTPVAISKPIRVFIKHRVVVFLEDERAHLLHFKSIA